MLRTPVAALLTLSTLASFAASITLTGVVRDFPSDGVNFEGKTYLEGQSFGLFVGLVEKTLVGPSPKLTALGASKINAENFNQWFTKTSNKVPLTLTLQETADGSGVYTYNDNSFFPINGQELGNQNHGHNFHFTFSAAAQFTYKPGTRQTFTIRGDDDIWVYFDKQLGVDLGGVHRPATATVDMDELLAGKPEGVYSFDLFFAERHTTRSTLSITTSLILLPREP